VYDRHVLSDMLEASVQALLGLSQIECVRSFFALPLPLIFPTAHSVDKKGEKKGVKDGVKEGEKVGECSVTAVQVLLSLSASRPEHAGNCIGLLMNACLEPTAPPPVPVLDPVPVPAASRSSSSSSSTSTQSSSSSSSSSHTIPPAILTVKEAVSAAGGAALALKGVLMDSKDRSKFFESDPPEGT
jgi:hypothetical protein